MGLSASPIPWLPANCLTARRAAEPFERIVAAWASEWFKGDGWHVLGTWDAVGQPDASDWTILRDASRLQLKAKPKAMQTLALAVLGMDEQPKCTEQDLRLMRRVAGRALDDLQVRLEQGLGSGQATNTIYPGENGATYSLLIGIVGGAQLAVECAAADLVALVRQTYPATSLPDDLQDASTAPETQPIKVAAHLGSASISIEQIAGLETGDILILDRSADASVHLRINDTPTDLPFALGEADGKITLELQELT